ncbi:MAG TPA: rhomboid family intramembrane serine protease [Galbitalea sp.]|nr:rhomboid family intramembrane serine protease [Galbitalea sp.]
MTDSTTDTDNRCYRHPDRETFVKCQRCGRSICGQCQTLAPVGVHCPECVREARGSAAASVRPIGRRFARVVSPSGGRPIVSFAIIGLCLVIYAIQYFTGDERSPVTNDLIYAPFLTSTQPWRMMTSIFIHASILHVALNMYSLWVVGPTLEAVLGRIRYLVLFLVAGFGGSVAVLLIAPAGEGVLGASGAIFGLFGAYFIIARRMGGNATYVLVIIVLNLVIGFVPGLGIAWQAHVGGLVAGGAVAFIYLETRQRSRRWVQVLLVALVTVILIGLTVFKASLLG